MSASSRLFRAGLVPFRQSRLQELRLLSECLTVQRSTLFHLLKHAQSTQFGIDHGFDKINSVAEYQKRVPLRTYEDFFRSYFKPAAERAAELKKITYNPSQDAPWLENITWPGLIRFFSLSSGTTSGTTKFIPLTRELLYANYRASIDLAVLHASRNKNTHPLQGKTFLLGGNVHLRNEWHGKIQSGDLSGVVARELPWFAKSKTFPPEEIASISDWEQKINQAIEAAQHEDIGILGGVPSWVLIFLERLNKRKKFKGNIRSLWPSFELLVHGGISFEPYRPQFEEWLGPGVYYQEVYPASEAFVAIEDPYYHTLRLMVDYGIFYEFVPLDELNSDSPVRHTLAEAEIGQNYAVVLTTNGGLWSYVIGDTIRFLSKDPSLLKVTGRTKFYLSAFGEHLIQEEIEKALSVAAETEHAQITDYHVAPLFPSAPDKLGRHQYLIEFTKSPRSFDEFSKTLDKTLQKLNEDYAAHRAKGFGMVEPEIISVRCGFFNDWMKAKGKLGGQHKFPRISNQRNIIEELLDSSRL